MGGPQLPQGTRFSLENFFCVSGWFLQMATSFFFVEFSTEICRLTSVHKDFMACEGEQSRDKTQKKNKLFGVEVSIL